MSSTPNRPQPEPWGDTFVIAGARLWSYRRETLLILIATVLAFVLSAGTPGENIPLVIALAVILYAVRRPLWRWLYVSRVRRQWSRAVISAGAADPPAKRSRKAQTLLGPKVLKVKITTVGDLLTVRVGRGRGTVESLTAHSHQLAADLDGRRTHVREIRVEPTEKASRAQVLVVRRDPFENRLPVPWPFRGEDKLSMWDPIPIGIDEDGDTIAIRLVEKNLLIGGIPGAGKSAALALITATAALDPNCRLYLLDGKQVDMAEWKPSAEALVGPNIAEANALLQHLRNVMAARFEELLAEGIRKVRPGAVQHVLICDELQVYVQDNDRKQRGLFIDQLRDLIARGRAAGVIVVAATQKPAADVIPSSIRDLMQLRFALRCTTPQASDTILGDGMRSIVDASTIAPEQHGVGYLLAEGTRPVRLKTFYLTDHDIDTIASRATGNRMGDEFQQYLAEVAPPPEDPHPTAATRPNGEELIRCLTTEGDGITRAEWAALAGRRQWKYLADDAQALLERGVVVQTGTGVRGSPFRYRLAGTADGVTQPSEPFGIESDDLSPRRGE